MTLNDGSGWFGSAGGRAAASNQERGPHHYGLLGGRRRRIGNTNAGGGGGGGGLYPSLSAEDADEQAVVGNDSGGIPTEIVGNTISTDVVTAGLTGASHSAPASPSNRKPPPAPAAPAPVSLKPPPPTLTTAATAARNAVTEDSAPTPAPFFGRKSRSHALEDDNDEDEKEHDDRHRHAAAPAVAITAARKPPPPTSSLPNSDYRHNRGSAAASNRGTLQQKREGSYGDIRVVETSSVGSNHINGGGRSHSNYPVTTIISQDAPSELSELTSSHADGTAGAAIAAATTATPPLFNTTPAPDAAMGTSPPKPPPRATPVSDSANAAYADVAATNAPAARARGRAAAGHINDMSRQTSEEIDNLARALAVSESSATTGNGISNEDLERAIELSKQQAPSISLHEATDEQVLAQAMAASQQESETERQIEMNDLEKALQASKQELEQQSTLGGGSAHAAAVVSLPILTDELLELVREHARTVRALCRNESVDADLLKFALQECQDDHTMLTRHIEGADDEKLGPLLDLNGIVLNAVELGQEVAKRSCKPAAITTTTHGAADSSSSATSIATLVMTQDIFSLICMLRAPTHEQRLQAALALCSFARQAEQPMSHSGNNDEDHQRLRNEICSSGGLQSLLALFRARSTLYELKVVAALAVAFVLPAFCTGTRQQTKPSLGLKIMDCLRFLSQARQVNPLDHPISQQECFSAAAMGLTAFWINQLEPMLQTESDEAQLGRDGNDADVAPLLELKRQFSTNSRKSAGLGHAGDIFDQRQESIELQELMEMSVSLIVHIATQNERGRVPLERGNPVLLIEQVCAVEPARPIAVREGILSLLIGWIGSRDPDKIRQASSALRYLTSIKDKYMAGWIHSQMVNEGALPGVVSLTRDDSLSHDVRLAIAQILASLCVAPHTRAAVVEASCIHFLIDILYQYTDGASEDATLFAGRAVLLLAAGAISRASVFSSEDLQQYVSADKRDTLIDDIVARGAIASFVGIAKSKKGKLRTVAVEALRVLSEDMSPTRKTRIRLCEDGAADALGVALSDSVQRWSEMNTLPDVSELASLHEALCALGNILEPLSDQSAPSSPSRTKLRNVDAANVFTQGCIHLARSGGLEALLFVVNLLFTQDMQVDHRTSILYLVEEACRSLSLLSPYLIRTNVSRLGYTRWANNVFAVFERIIGETSQADDSGETSHLDLQINSLQGVAALAKLAPLQMKVVDKLLPFIVQAKAGHENAEVSQAAGQAFQSLDFTEDEIAAQLVGNNPSLLADYYCIQRSLMLQAMARKEVAGIVQRLWEHVSDTGEDDLALSAFDVFTIINREDPYAAPIDTITRQYSDVYSPRKESSDIELRRAISHSDQSVEQASFAGDNNLLRKQIYPLNCTGCESEWVLGHIQALEDQALDLSLHASKLLEHCFPSRLLRDHVVPILTFQPDAPFDFRALLMPKQRYLSFRREGQLLSRLCGRESSSSKFDSPLWMLVFTDSSFAGEFSESLVQALYLCPMIHALSLTRSVDSDDTSSLDRDGVSNKSGGALLANLAGSLPPWVTALTFDRVIDDRGLRTLTTILNAMGRLATARELESSVRHLSVDQKGAAFGSNQSQGRFAFLAIRNTIDPDTDAWASFFRLLGRTGRFPRGGTSTPLGCLKCLDLSGNRLGDELCASLLEICHDKDSDCRLEALDLSGNSIGAGNAILKVLSGYVQYYRSEQLTGTKISSSRFKSSLHTLRLCSNGLGAAKTWLEITALLKNNALDLTNLDLDDNELTLDEDDYDSEVLLMSALTKNTTLRRLSLSRNRFTAGAVDLILARIDRPDHDSGLAFLQFDDNEPRLSDTCRSRLSSFCARSRRTVMRRHASAGGLACGSSDADEDSKTPEDLGSRGGASGDETNRITVLFSAPLVYRDTTNTLRPFAKLDFNMERELLWQCLKEASRDIQIAFDTATHNRLLASMTRRCSCLHYSGHGHAQYLPFEDGRGGPHWLSIVEIRNLIAAREGGVPFNFVFVSACHSEQAGATFALAGVPHVVCCQQEFELKDVAALAFTRQFYLALAVGHTVKESFDQGCKAVRLHPNLKNADDEMSKFVLLPKDGNHDVPIFDAKPVLDWPVVIGQNTRVSFVSRQRVGFGGTANSSEISVRNMMQEDPSPSPPQFFAAREVEMYHVIGAVLAKRLVSVVGESGIGRSSLVCAVCHYINERASTIAEIKRIYHVRVKQVRGSNIVRNIVSKLLKKLVDSGTMQQVSPEADVETVMDHICHALKNQKALIVFDKLELLEKHDETNEFPMLLSNLFRETRSIRVLLTARRALGISSLGGQVEHTHQLGALNFGDTMRLFSNLCPLLQTQQERKHLFEALAKNADDEVDMLPNDARMRPTTKMIYAKLGNGVPSRIEKSAYVTTKEELAALTGNTFADEQSI